jgi:hypothetical protein
MVFPVLVLVFDFKEFSEEELHGHCLESTAIQYSNVATEHCNVVCKGTFSLTVVIQIIITVLVYLQHVVARTALVVLGPDW